MAGPAPKNRDLSRHPSGFSQHGMLSLRLLQQLAPRSSKCRAAMTTICSYLEAFPPCASRLAASASESARDRTKYSFQSELADFENCQPSGLRSKHDIELPGDDHSPNKPKLQTARRVYIRRPLSVRT
ncbi:hypothetical protein HER10_EVM0013198 [Colletotrichum scovillei]|uniref:uncharacterized protein n=1 Tax=Colletotrichum scovillei TaxID=1209932 RepID=UPI0015C3DD95|nr:uncharacterized protein HER10_EVM0013198 [Colletotrichum scovillei]KAF4780594.1 hypothetical protein HER10_EVM0013198 [Colletotrichum scovillei]